ncbi:MAG: 30S ribosomal protein S15 [Candidatus Aenigmarchaeota archaeon]|nr:30S ribosomal protein S15 [Candidatus Aenigmarchaeota archaeon]
MLAKDKKKKIIDQFKVHDQDVGSSKVQIAILSEEINELAIHLKRNTHDYSSRRGLIRKISQRRKLLNYLKKEDEKSYQKLIKKLNLKH